MHNLYKKYAAGLLLGCLAMVPATTTAQRLQQTLGRGVAVAKNGSTALVSWRRLAQEPEQAKWNIYVNGTKLNATPIANTNYQTTAGKLPAGSLVTVTMVNGEQESEPSTAFEVKDFDCRNMFMHISFDGSPLAAANFNTSYVWPIDLNGDGEMDYVVNRLNTGNALDAYVEGYLRTGEHLWTVKLGPNELSCSGQDDMITVADMDCDGRGDVVIQSSDGTQFWNPETHSFGLYVNGKTNADTDGDGIINYETQATRNAPRYISVIDGMTGREKASVEQSYNQHYNRTNRAQLMGDEYNKHVGHMGVFSFDGIHPAVVMEWHTRNADGSHHYYNGGWAFDFTNGTAGQLRELFNEPTGAPAFHQIRVGDVDGDGRDEMIVGGYTMDHTGQVLFNTGISHGDRFRTTDINPERPGLETFAIQQYAPDMLGQILYDAATGEPIKKWYLSAVGDIGRGECIDIDPTHLGWEMWSTMDGNVYDAEGNLIEGLQNQYPCEGLWWDGELDREVVQTSDSHYNVYVQDFYKGRLIEIAKASNWRYVTVYAKRAAFWGDIIGDWREELILLHKENGVCVGIAGFTTDYATNVNNIYCLQEDPHYRGDCSTKGYYQSPNPGFYLGYDMPRPQLPPTMVTDVVLAPTATAWTAAGFTNYARSAQAQYSDGKSVLIDLNAGQHINVPTEVKPSVLYAMTVKGQNVTLQGNGALAGNMDLWKGQQGQLTVNIPMTFSGKTYITEGVLEVNNSIAGDVELRARGTLAGKTTVNGQLFLEGALNYEGCRLCPGTNAQPIDTMKLNKGLNINGRLFAEMDIKDEANASDLIYIIGDLNIAEGGKLVFTIVPDAEKPAPGRYKLMEYTGEFSGNMEQIGIRGLTGISCSIVNEENALWLVINEQREAANGVHWTGNVNGNWNYTDENFAIDGEPTAFVAGDAVTIGDDAQQTTITLNELMPVGNVTFENNAQNITVNGAGGFSGTGSLVMNGNGRLTLNAVKSNYTGPTIINSGTVTVKELADGGLPSSIGAASANADNLQIGKATLVVNNVNAATNRGITLTDTATVHIPSGVTAFKGVVKGSNGVLCKTGNGQLNITYGGTNPWKATILQGGTLAQGMWNATIGNATSLIHVTGNSTFVVFDTNTSSQTPTFRNTLLIDEGKTLTVRGGQRCTVQNTLQGKGTLRISFPYVRGDVAFNASQFEGIIDVTSGQYRLTQAMDLSKGTLHLGAGVYATSVKAGSSTETSYTHKIGELSSTAADCTLATGVWNVGYAGTDATFAGIVNSAATLNKYGEGKLSLTGSSSGNINVNEGTLSIENATLTTSGTISVKNGAMLRGTGATKTVVVANGGSIAVGKTDNTLGTFNVNDKLTVQAGGQVVVKCRQSRCDAYKVTNATVLNSPHFVMKLMNGNWLEDAELKVFTGTGTITLSGTPTFEPAIPMEGYEWDYSQLASDGIIGIKADATGIGDAARLNDKYKMINEKQMYDLQGRPVENPGRGVYIVNGKKTVIK